MKLKSSSILASLTLSLFSSCQSDNTESSGASTDSPESTEPQSGYPLDTCVVSGEKLGSMGEPYVITHEGTEVRFCCDSCLPKFKKDPEKYLAKLETE